MPVFTEILTTPSTYQIEQVAEIAAQGFNRKNDDENYKDTVEHCRTADHLQIARNDDGLVGFALYRSCLWRQGS